MANLTSFIIAFSIVVFILYKFRPLARRIKLIDNTYQKSIPLIGGIAMFCGFILALLTLDMPLSGLRFLIAGATILVIVGILDDFHELSVSIRFITQIMVAVLITISGDIVIHDLGTIGLLGWFAEPLTILAILGAINAVNMTDGIDGLAGGLTLITISALAFISWQANLYQELNLVLLLISCLLAFLIFNAPYRKKSGALIFMGDAGSMFLGFMIVWFLISLSQGEQPAMSPVTTLWIFALPLFEITTIMIFRTLKGSSPCARDRKHIHYILLELGFTVHKTLLVLFGTAILIAVSGLLGFYLGVSDKVMFWTFMALFGLYFILYLKLVAISRMQ
ncbi:undecaprenyl/decaprenyl-phosphate alpha-N-acetylglucosaminyl 1-phosphate transferase [Candidatus Marithrix sp. Canyon 246]|uniref:undecaprenyl/decaprenyl-phosphate alpha-N-acetylglucosaminyl 1-phosphate transferase n=1 Tax=Candidatus Marithrix sp. Canyon 246 TaxID=1827136 RepID=UPI00084A14A3|nr:undecaprenyl/decaprenyl-phosphate alpha-N-acetylglucosaminyl 1-phosphate transferase [Candidatus Marithrix sp. Canyon 246]